METTTENRKIEIGQDILNNLNTSRKWSMFLAIIGFIFLGLFIVIGVITGIFLTAFNSGASSIGLPESLLVVIFIILALLYFFPVLFLFCFSKHIAHAVQTLDNQAFYKAFKNLKSFFVYVGVLLIIVISLYTVTLIVAGTSMIFLKGLG